MQRDEPIASVDASDDQPIERRIDPLAAPRPVQCALYLPPRATPLITLPLLLLLLPLTDTPATTPTPFTAIVIIIIIIILIIAFANYRAETRNNSSKDSLLIVTHKRFCWIFQKKIFFAELAKRKRFSFVFNGGTSICPFS